MEPGGMDPQVIELPDDGQATPALSAGIAGDPPANPTPVSGSGTIPEETPAERFERLRTRILKKKTTASNRRYGKGVSRACPNTFSSPRGGRYASDAGDCNQSTFISSIKFPKLIINL